MSRSNIHLIWIVGVLLTLLIGTLAVQWNGIPDLPGLISFAVGLASLILAVIAIFQTLTSTSNVEAALAAVRTTAEGALKTGQSLSESADLVRRVAEEARDAAGRASDASADFSGKVAAVISSNEINIAEISRVREEIELSRTEFTKPRDTVDKQTTVKTDIFPNGLTMGGATTAYAAVKCFKSEASFAFKDFVGDFGSYIFYDAYLAALDDTGIISFSRNSKGKYVVRSVDQRLIDYIDLRARTKFYTTESREENIRQRIAGIDAFFESPPA